MLLLAVEVSFYLLCLAVLLLPVRWGVWAYVLASGYHLAGMRVAAEGYTFASASTIGIGGAFNVVVLPAILIAKLKFSPLRIIWESKILRYWVIFTIYVAISSLFTPYFTSALKMVAYIGWYPFVFALFTSFWARGYIKHKNISIVFWVFILLAVIQTYILGVFGNGDRFTAFINVQYFGVFLASFMVYFIYSKNNLLNNVSAFVAVLSIVLTGSRYVLLSAVAIILVYWFLVKYKNGLSLRGLIGVSFKTLFLALLVIGFISLIPFTLPDSRINELLVKALLSGGGYEAVGTLAWRVGMYIEAIDHIEGRGIVGYLFGSGTSSAAEVGLEYRPDRYSEAGIDANRIVHNEYIRALYEWGVVGLYLMVYSVFGSFVASYKMYFNMDIYDSLPFISLFPLVAGSMIIENSLSGSGSIAGVSYVLFSSMAYARLLSGGGQ